MIIKKYIKLLLMTLSVALFTACQSSVDIGLKKENIVSSNIERNYLVYVPSIYKKENQAVPLLFVFHGGGSKASKIAEYSKFHELANKENFILVYPNAIEKNWNDGRDVKKFKSHREKIDDMRFVLDIINELAYDYKIKRDKVFITGISNGGMFTQRLASEYSSYFKAAASVVGGMPQYVAEKFQPKQSIPFLLIAGTKDPLMPFEGGGVGFTGSRGKVISMEESISKWVNNNNADKLPRIEQLPDIDPNDGTRVKKMTYVKESEKSAEVVYFEIQDGGHNWSGADKGLSESIVGKLSQDISATDEIWKFFKEYLE